MSKDDWTVRQAQDWLLQHAEAGVGCPCCDQLVKLYKRKLNSAMARALIIIYWYFEREDAEEWLQVPTYLNWTQALGDAAKLHWWGLIEPKRDAVRDDGSKKTGYYRITELGQQFVRGEAEVPKYIYLYNQCCLGFCGPPTTISEALGDKFNYAELMAATPEA